MDHYEHCLHAMIRLLEAVGEKHWSAWLREDVRLWQATSDTRHHLAAYGGMGSFNDVWICPQNQHSVTEAQEPWANVLFEWLKTLCYYLARNPQKKVTAASLSKAVGRHDAVLAAFVGGDEAPVSMRGRVNGERMLEGCRCLDCGHAEVSTRDIERAIAQQMIPLHVFQACEAQILDKLVEAVLRLDVQGAEEARQETVSAATASGIEVHDRDGWMRPCPTCGKDDTATYRWRYVRSPQAHFVPTDDNLPMRA
jgi:hypothetical protein